ncbi:hypothetical protein BGZ58_005236, partial [Dissophora ornata]
MVDGDDGDAVEEIDSITFYWSIAAACLHLESFHFSFSHRAKRFEEQKTMDRYFQHLKVAV